jgi:hypothetical protein
MLKNTLLNEIFCLGAAILIWFFKGLGVLSFLPGWPIVLLAILAITNFIVNKFIYNKP